MVIFHSYVKLPEGMSFGITYPLWMEMILSFWISGWIVSFEASVIQRHLDRLSRKVASSDASTISDGS
jgi:hypothetical protein